MGGQFVGMNSARIQQIQNTGKCVDRRPKVVRDDGEKLVFDFIESFKFLTACFHLLLVPQEETIDLTAALTAAVYRNEEDDAKGHDDNEDVADKFLSLDCVFL